MTVGCPAGDDKRIAIVNLVAAIKTYLRELFLEFDIAEEQEHLFHLVQYSGREFIHTPGILFPTNLTIKAAFRYPLWRSHADVELVRSAEANLVRQGRAVEACVCSFHHAGLHLIYGSLSAQGLCVLRQNL